jgi:hypothetical protein
MPLRKFEPDRRGPVLVLGGLVILLSLAGCWKKSGEAIVLEKIYVPARPVSVSPNESRSPAASEPTQTPAEQNSTETATEPADDTIQPALDPRAVEHEQWIVAVEMVDDLKKIDVRIDAARWEKLKPRDRVRVSYRQGKYTGTIWNAELK